MLFAGISQRLNRKALAQQWRWIALISTFLVVLTVYLLGRDSDTPPIFEYQDLLTTTNANNCSAPIQLGGMSRLARTLAGNERRYQRMIIEREKIIEKSGGMGINAFGPKHILANLLWDYFIPAFSCPFPMYRVGALAEGGKYVCGVERMLHSRPNCLIYSLNHKTPSYSSFEEDMLERSAGCRIYAFDANATHNTTSKWPWGETDIDTEILKPRVYFNQFALSDPSSKKYRSLQSIMSAFNHDWIDILKIDLLGAEFATLILTVNIGLSENMKTVGHFNDWFTRLECAGLRPYYFEVSMNDVNNRRLEPSIVYWSFMNIRGRHALVDDELPEYP
ncbi:hypothetical protein B0H14DRAFT_3895206 [Mycena olivaceomarginata]|nr:hypothetical protein B0H14DRAFT_3895206 [Mycena olivaceomarginata]